MSKDQNDYYFNGSDKPLTIYDVNELASSLHCMANHTDWQGRYLNIVTDEDGHVKCGECQRLLFPTMLYDCSDEEVTKRSYWDGKKWVVID